MMQDPKSSKAEPGTGWCVATVEASPKVFLKRDYTVEKGGAVFCNWTPYILQTEQELGVYG